MSAVAHPATPEPRISSRSCGAVRLGLLFAPRLLLDELENVLLEWWREVEKGVLLLEEVDTQHLRSPTYELHRIPDPEEVRWIIRWMVVLRCVAL